MGSFSFYCVGGLFDEEESGKQRQSENEEEKSEKLRKVVGRECE